MNKIMLVSMFLIGFCLIVLAIYISFIKPINSQYMEYNGVKLSLSDYQRIKELSSTNVVTTVCNVNSKDCINLWDIDKLKEMRSGGIKEVAN